MINHIFNLTITEKTDLEAANKSASLFSFRLSSSILCFVYSPPPLPLCVLSKVASWLCFNLLLPRTSVNHQQPATCLHFPLTTQCNTSPSPGPSSPLLSPLIHFISQTLACPASSSFALLLLEKQTLLVLFLNPAVRISISRVNENVVCDSACVCVWWALSSLFVSW